MTSESLAQLSNNAMYAASIVYVLAFLAHVIEWAKARDLSEAPGRTRRVLVSSTARPQFETPPGSADAVNAATESSDDEVERSDKFGRIGYSLTVLGLMIQLVGVVSRGVAAERVPWGSMYEFAITGSLAVAVAYVILVRLYDVRWLGLLVTGFLVIVLGLAMLVLYRPVGPLVPALHSYWLVIHVSSAAIAGGAFTVGALASVLFLIRNRAETKAAANPDAPRKGFVWRMPDSESIDRVAYRVHAFAFPLWTFAVLCGAIWAKYSWGRFWGWDPKEVWAFITWVAYAAYLHARATAGWKGKAAAYIGLFAYATFIFNFVGINLFGSGLHSYSGM